MTLVGFSQNGVRRHHLVADDRGVVDQDVDPALLARHPVEQRLGLLVVGMVDGDRDAFAACGGHQFGGLVDRARPAQTGRASRCGR